MRCIYCYSKPTRSVKKAVSERLEGLDAIVRFTRQKRIRLDFRSSRHSINVLDQ
jgi:hypothetical protein